MNKPVVEQRKSLLVFGALAAAVLLSGATALALSTPSQAASTGYTRLATNKKSSYNQGGGKMTYITHTIDACKKYRYTPYGSNQWQVKTRITINGISTSKGATKPAFGAAHIYRHSSSKVTSQVGSRASLVKGRTYTLTHPASYTLSTKGLINISLYKTSSGRAVGGTSPVQFTISKLKTCS